MESEKGKPTRKYQLYRQRVKKKEQDLAAEVQRLSQSVADAEGMATNLQERHLVLRDLAAREEDSQRPLEKASSLKNEGGATGRADSSNATAAMLHEPELPDVIADLDLSLCEIFNALHRYREPLFTPRCVAGFRYNTAFWLGIQKRFVQEVQSILPDISAADPKSIAELEAYVLDVRRARIQQQAVFCHILCSPLHSNDCCVPHAAPAAHPFSASLLGCMDLGSHQLAALLEIKHNHAQLMESLRRRRAAIHEQMRTVCENSSSPSVYTHLTSADKLNEELAETLRQEALFGLWRFQACYAVVSPLQETRLYLKCYEFGMTPLDIFDVPSLAAEYKALDADALQDIFTVKDQNAETSASPDTGSENSRTPLKEILSRDEKSLDLGAQLFT